MKKKPKYAKSLSRQLICGNMHGLFFLWSDEDIHKTVYIFCRLSNYLLKKRNTCTNNATILGISHFYSKPIRQYLSYNFSTNCR